MTLQIKSTDTISGISLKEARGFFREIVAWHSESFELGWLQEKLSLDEKSTFALALELAARGYVELLEGGEYKLTERGHELVQASAAGNVTRKTAEAALIGLLERVARYNTDQDKIFTIEAVIVFGSFLGMKEELGDLDVAVKYRDRNSQGDRATRALAYAEQSGRYFGSFIDRICWANTELRQVLKARKRTIAIQEWDAFLRLAKKAEDKFRYRVAFGNPEGVEAEIQQSRFPHD